MKKYFRSPYDEEYVRTIEMIYDECDGIDDIVIEEMERDYGGPMWCSVELLFVDNDCGRDCPKYEPCNGKSGKCRHLVNGFKPTGREFRLDIDGEIHLLEENL